MTNTTMITIIIFGFTFIPLILAEIARAKSVPSVEDFFVSGRSMSAVLCFFTIYGTWYSTFAVIGSSAYFYLNGPVYMTTFAWNALFAICIFLLGRRIWFYGKIHGYITPTDFFKDIYQSKALTFIVTAVMLIFTLPYIQIQFSGGAHLIEIASDGQIPWEIAGLIFYIVMIVYMWAGGIRAVALTDVFLGILVFVAMMGTGLILTSKAGGVNNIFDTLAARDVSNVTLSGYDSDNNITLWLTMFMVTPLGAIMSPPMWIRHYSIKKEKTFYLMPFLITLMAVGYVGCFLAGNAGKILEPHLLDSDTLIPFLILKYGGKLFTAILFCGFAAASLSTANSQIHALSAIYTIDIHKNYINKEASNKRLLSVAKWSIMGFSGLAYAIMLYRPSFIINTGLLALSGTAQILVPTFGALFWKNSTSQGACVGIIGGISTLLLLYLLFDLDASLCGAIGLIVNMTLFFIVCMYSDQNPAVRNKIINYRIEFFERNSRKRGNHL